MVWPLIISVSLWISPPATSQPRMAFISALQTHGLYAEAALEYQRSLFLHSAPSESNGLLWLKLGLCYRQLNREADMMRAFGMAHALLQQPDHRDILYREIAITYLARGRTLLSRHFLDRIRGMDHSDVDEKLRVFSLYLDQDWPSFSKHVAALQLSPETRDQLHEQAARQRRTGRRHRRLKLINYILPGTAAIATGSVQTALETGAYHGFLINEIFSGNAWPGRILMAASLVRLYLYHQSFTAEYLNEHFRRLSRTHERDVFTLLFAADW